MKTLFVFFLIILSSLTDGIVVLSPSNSVNETYNTPTIPHNHPHWYLFETELVASIPIDACDIESITNAEDLAGKAALIAFYSCDMNTKCKLFKQLNVSGLVVMGNGGSAIGTLAFYDSPECNDIPCVEIIITAPIISTVVDSQEQILISFTSSPNMWVELNENGALYFHTIVLMVLSIATSGLAATRLYQFVKYKKLSFSASVICLTLQFFAGIILILYAIDPAGSRYIWDPNVILTYIMLLAVFVLCSSFLVAYFWNRALESKYADSHINKIKAGVIIGIALIVLLSVINLVYILTYAATYTISSVLYIIYGLAYICLIVFFVVEGIRVSKRIVGRTKFRVKLSVWMIVNAVSCFVSVLYYLIQGFAPTDDIWSNYVLLLVVDFSTAVLFFIQAGSFHVPSAAKTSSAASGSKSENQTIAATNGSSTIELREV